MKTFDDLEWPVHPHDPNGKQGIAFFENGYGVSVVNFKSLYGPMSYTDNDSEWELAVLRGTNFADSRLDYGTPITDDVLGHLSPEDVTEVMRRIQELPHVKK